jgi:replicative DNA helicase
VLERSVLIALLNRDAWLRYGGLFDTHFFSSEAYRSIFRLIRDTWGEYDGEALVIPREILIARVEGETVDQDTEETLKRTLGIMYEGTHDRELLEGLIRDVLFKWRAKDYLVDAAQQLEMGELDLYNLSSRFQTLAKATEQEEGEESNLVDDALTLLQAETMVRAYPTGLTELDFQLGGGLWAGEEGVLVAPTHRGKTWALVHLGAVSLQAGIPVQHHTHEISRRRVAIRYYQNLLRKDRLWILENGDAVRSLLQELELPIWSIRDHGSGGVTTAKIRKEVGSFVEMVDTPPLIIVDYLDLVSSADRRLEGRFALTAVAQELREIAAEYDVGIWTATQANRPSWQSAHVRMNDVSEAVGKVEKADIVVTMNQLPEEKLAGAMRFYVDKARERMVAKPEVPVIALPEIQRFEDMTDGFDWGPHG